MNNDREFLEKRIKIMLARKSFWGYCIAIAPDFYNEGYLKEICNAIQEFENDDNEILIINAPPRHGKKLSDDTPVLTTQGWKKHGDLKIGDYVYNQNGLPVKILNVLPKTIDYDYKIKFSNGEEIIAHYNHDWIVYDRNAKKIKKVETNYMINNLDNKMEHKRGHRYRFQIPLIKPLKGEYKKLLVHPYVLGAWLGDGSNRAGRITSDKQDLSIINKISEFGYEISSQQIHKKTGVYSTYLKGLRKDLQKYNMCYCNITIEKHIPEDYFNASIDQRLLLLAGLLDTDGSLRKKEHRYIFTTADKKLKDDFIKLVSTFNWRCNIREIQPSLSTSGIQGKKIYWQIGFNPTINIPCVLARKQLFEFSKQRKISITSIEKMKKKTTGNCITVEGGVYLVGNTLIPTHNSRTITLATQWLLGKNPQYKIITCSYNEELSLTFSKAVRDAIAGVDSFDKKSITFKDIFPKTSIKKGSSAAKKWGLANNQQDNYLATSPHGTSSGIGAHFIIIDDLIKDAEEAYNARVLEEHWDWYKNTILSRGENNKSKVIVIATRWNTKDLAGRLIEACNENNVKYRLLTFRACTDGKMLNENILNYEKYQMRLKFTDEAIVRANYDQEPIDLKGKLYEHLVTYDNKPNFVRIEAVCDTADTGSDYLCSIVYGKTEDKMAYILDVIYTKESMETTEQKVAKQFTDYQVSIAHIESNGGGRGFSRAVERICRQELGNRITTFKPYTQTLNKQSRILSNATAVELNVRFPKDWKQLYPEFYKSVTEYQREGKNAHDDAEDALTSIIEKTVLKGGLKFA